MELREYWTIIRRPSVHFSLGFLTLGGFIGGIIFWGAFNTAMEATNTEAFCTGCHEMHDNVLVELKTTIHYTNRSGVRAVKRPARSYMEIITRSSARTSAVCTLRSTSG